jgi:hypothetical protein
VGEVIVKLFKQQMNQFSQGISSDGVRRRRQAVSCVTNFNKSKRHHYYDRSKRQGRASDDVTGGRT